MLLDYIFSAILLVVAITVFTVLLVRLDMAHDDARRSGRSRLSPELLRKNVPLLWCLQGRGTTSR